MTKQEKLVNRWKRLLQTTKRHARVERWWNAFHDGTLNARKRRMAAFNTASLRVCDVYFWHDFQPIDPNDSNRIYVNAR